MEARRLAKTARPIGLKAKTARLLKAPRFLGFRMIAERAIAFLAEKSRLQGRPSRKARPRFLGFQKILG